MPDIRLFAHENRENLLTERVLIGRDPDFVRKRENEKVDESRCLETGLGVIVHKYVHEDILPEVVLTPAEVDTGENIPRQAS